MDSLPASIPGLERSPGEGIGYSLQYSQLVAQLVKNPPAMQETWVQSLDSIPGLGRSCGEGKSYSLQYSSLENSIDCIFHGAAKIQIRQSFTFTFLYQLSYTEALTGAVLWLICSQTTFSTIWHFAHTLTQTARPLSFCSACISCILYSFYKCLLDNPKRSDVCCRYSDKHKREEFYSHGVIGL